MSYTLRPYQRQAVEKAVEFIKSPKNKGAGLIVAPTGSGKSHMISGIAESQGGALVLQPNLEILRQNTAKMVAAGIFPMVYSASASEKRVGDFTVATIGSIVRKPELFRRFGLVIIDEAHLVNAKSGMYRDFLAAIGDAKMIGLTGTPYRLFSNSLGSQMRFLTRTRPKIFSRLIDAIQIPDLYRQGYLCPLKYDKRRLVDPSKLQGNSTGADYLDKSVEDYFRRNHYIDKLVEVSREQLSLGRTPVIFTRFVKEAEEVARRVHGVEVVSQKTKKEDRDAILRDYRRGDVPGVVNVGVVGIGFDHPGIDSVVLGALSKSLARYVQQVGRGMRLSPKKEVAHVIDLVGLSDRFGQVETFELRRGGKKGESYAFFSGDRQITNVYFGHEGARL